MRSYYLAKDAVALADGRVRVTFETGETGILDCKPFMFRPFWRKLSSPAFFSLVRVEDGILTWPEDIDIAPEDVWEKTLRDSNFCESASSSNALSFVAEDGPAYGAKNEPAP